MRYGHFCTSVVLLSLALAGPAAARGTLDSILPDIRSAHPGRRSDAEPWTDEDGRVHYKIKWLTPEGRILYFNADADSGRYSSSDGGGDVGRQWRGGRGYDDPQSEDNGGGRRSHWNGGDGDTGGDRRGNGDWRDRYGDHGQGDWHGGGQDGGGRDRGQGGWHDGRGGDPNGHGDDGGHHHHGGN